MSAIDIINYYKENPNLKNKEIAVMFSVSPQYVSRILKDSVENKESKATTIKVMFYEQHKSIVDISNETCVSVPSVRKILKEDSLKFLEEKKKRKTKTIERNKKNRRKVTNRADSIEEVRMMANLERMQRMCAIEDSTTRKLTNRDLINMNRQHYRYNIKKDRYELKDMDCEIPCGLPRVFKISSEFLSSEIDEMSTGKFYGK